MRQRDPLLAAFARFASVGSHIVKNALRALRRRKVQALAAAAIVVGGGAIASIMPAVAASATPDTAAAPAAVSMCTTSHLRVWLGVPGDGTAGTTYYALEMSNISSTPCTVYGYPGVSAVSGTKQLGSAARRNAGTSQLLTLGRGATVYVKLGIVDIGAYSATVCPRVTATGLRVYPPNNTASVIVPFSFRACGKAGPSFLSVTPAAAGTGIPGFNV
jgi:hypothetical protein